MFLRENIGMSSLNTALDILVAQGHTVETNPGVCVVDGEMHVPIDGRLRSASEICEMVTPVDKDVFGFEAHKKQFEVHVYYLYGGAAYEIHEDGKRLGNPQRLNENVLEFVQRIATDMGGGSLRRL